jgi:hypothetical protein
MLDSFDVVLTKKQTIPKLQEKCRYVRPKELLRASRLYEIFILYAYSRPDSDIRCNSDVLSK